MYEVTVTTSISASHRLKGYMGKCENLHGHNYRIEVTVGRNSLDEVGLAVDFSVVKKQLKLVAERFDHTDLNQTEEFRHKNPSSENIAKLVYDVLKTSLEDRELKVMRVRVHETEGSFVTYYES
jgi:6-pyruvoyltetrahydropterin/6-carboxytetrahydropterin synthase